MSEGKSRGTRKPFTALRGCLCALGIAWGCADRGAPPLAPGPSADPRCTVLPAGARNLADVLEPLRRRYHLPALGAAVVTPERIEALGVVGVRDAARPVPACENDAFHLGSDSKAMTAVVLARLVEQGRLSWTTRIRDVFADLPEQHPAYADVSLEQLLAHRAGLSHDPTSVSLNALRHLPGDLREQRERYVAIALREPPEKPPGSGFSYSNTGYVIAGAMAERVTGRPWENLVREIVFAPLAMQNAGFGVTASQGQLDGLWAHAMANDMPKPIPPGPASDNPLYIAPAGGVHASLESWAEFIRDALAGFEKRGKLLSAESYAHLYDAPYGGDYAHGWVKVERPRLGGTAYMHAGSNTLNSALAWLMPKRRIGVIVATNAGGGRTFEACNRAVAEIMKRRAEVER